MVGPALDLWGQGRDDGVTPGLTPTSGVPILPKARGSPRRLPCTLYWTQQPCLAPFPIFFLSMTLSTRHAVHTFHIFVFSNPTLLNVTTPQWQTSWFVHCHHPRASASTWHTVGVQ